MIRDLIHEVWGDRAGTLCLDCCCGSGVGTAALRAGGMRALAYDNDPALLALGLSKGRLVPEDTMCIDAREAARYIAPVPLGVAFMAGEIYSYNTGLWERSSPDSSLSPTRC
jgi:SAM-dependent methyltransferase